MFRFSNEDVLNTRTVDVKYVSGRDELVVPQKVVSKEVLDRLVAGEKIRITYLTNNPNRDFYTRQRPQNRETNRPIEIRARVTRHDG